MNTSIPKTRSQFHRVAVLAVAVAIEMGLVARFYERLGDHAVNVARRVDAELTRAGPG